MPQFQDPIEFGKPLTPMEKLRWALAKRKARLPGQIEDLTEGVEQFGRGTMKGLADAGYSLAQGIGSLTGMERLRDAAILGKEEARQFYAPQGRAGAAGDIVGRVLGEGATSMAGGGAVLKGLTKAGPTLARLATAGGSGVLPSVLRGSAASALPDAALATARAEDVGVPVGSTVARELATNLVGGAALGGLAKAGGRAAAALRGADVPATPPVGPRRAVAGGPTTNLSAEDIAEGMKAQDFVDAYTAQKFVDTIDQLPSVPKDLVKVREDALRVATDPEFRAAQRAAAEAEGQIFDPIRPFNPTPRKSFTTEQLETMLPPEQVAPIRAARQAETKKFNRTAIKTDDVVDDAGRVVTYTIGDQPVQFEVKQAPGGRLNVDVLDTGKRNTIDPIGLKNAMTDIMKQENATGIVSWRRRDGKVITIDNPDNPSPLKPMSSADEKQLIKDLGLQNASRTTQQLYLSEYQSGVYLQGAEPKVVKQELQQILKDNPPKQGRGAVTDSIVANILPQSPRELLAARDQASIDKMMSELPLLDTSDEAMEAARQAAIKAREPRPMLPKNPVIPEFSGGRKVTDWRRLPRLDEEGAEMQRRARVELDLRRQMETAPKTRDLLKLRLDPEGVAEYIARTRRLSEFDKNQIRRSAELEDAIIADEMGNPVTAADRRNIVSDVELQRSLAEVEEQARRVKDVNDPYTEGPARVLSAESFDRMTPQQRYDFLEELKRSSQAMDAVGGLRGPVTWEVSPQSLRTPMRQILRESAAAADKMDLPSNFASWQQLNPIIDAGPELTSEQSDILLRRLVREMGGTMGKQTKAPKRKK